MPDRRCVFDAIAAGDAAAAHIAMRSLVDLALDDGSRSME
jgi:DNA-binding FadR family transcriptional regulator